MLNLSVLIEVEVAEINQLSASPSTSDQPAVPTYNGDRGSWILDKPRD
jgi:hypothetical protein